MKHVVFIRASQQKLLCFSHSGSEIAGEVVETGEGVTAVSKVSCILINFGLKEVLISLRILLFTNKAFFVCRVTELLALLLAVDFQKNVFFLKK